jgi:hypothetical protein
VVSRTLQGGRNGANAGPPPQRSPGQANPGIAIKEE